MRGPSGHECVLTRPPGVDERRNNNIKDGGHCFGFSVTALMMFDKALTRWTTERLLHPRSHCRQRRRPARIAEHSCSRTAQGAGRRAVRTPNQMLDALVAG